MKVVLKIFVIWVLLMVFFTRCGSQANSSISVAEFHYFVEATDKRIRRYEIRKVSDSAESRDLIKRTIVSLMLDSDYNVLSQDTQFQFIGIKHGNFSSINEKRYNQLAPVLAVGIGNCIEPDHNAIPKDAKVEIYFEDVRKCHIGTDTAKGSLIYTFEVTEVMSYEPYLAYEEYDLNLNIISRKIERIYGIKTDFCRIPYPNKRLQTMKEKFFLQ